MFKRRTSRTRRTPAALLALGRQAPPEQIRIRGLSFHLVRLFKHDFFAATGLYAGPSGKVVVKIGRRADFCGVPLAWIGRWLTRREAMFFNLFQDVAAVPALIGVWQGSGLVRQFIEGQPLSRESRVPDDFFGRLTETIEALHRRDVAYVDLEKPENVLLGDDGRPYLFDFQISWRARRRSANRLTLSTRLLRVLQQADRYHLLKLQRRIRPDQLDAESLRASYARPRYVQWHRKAAAPLLVIRRWVLDRLTPGRPFRERGRVSES